ncbi:MAG: AAA family ATPase, partial [Deltaproteobacteria bacterium]|nr:AAA family ATPase [Deltaproteobacteria bacterium]
MQRKQLELLSSWFDKKRRKPLVIRGARQVGKSTLVEMFARQNQIAICTVNLERYPELTSVFLSKDPRKIIQQIEFLPNIGSITPGTLLFLDEIQAIPEAIVALRYFYEDMPELAVVGAGSLLELALKDNTF